MNYVFVLLARYRGRELKRAAFVQRSAAALSTLPGVRPFKVENVEDMWAPIPSPEAVTDAVMALLAAGDWAITVAVIPRGSNDPNQPPLLNVEGTGFGGRNLARRFRDEAAEAIDPSEEPGAVEADGLASSPDSGLEGESDSADQDAASWLRPVSGDEINRAHTLASAAMKKSSRAGAVKVIIAPQPGVSTKRSVNSILEQDCQGVAALLGFLLSKRSVEGREATSLVRSGLSQVEAAEQLGISKQAISQRLQAAGWQAESQGWRLLVNSFSRAAGIPLEIR